MSAELLAGRIGEKLVIGTTTLHYLCGRLAAIEADTAVFLVGTQRIRIPLSHVATVGPAIAAQAEFVK
ncbi:MAG: hypothetical protein JWN44_3361 [Myxococcales bacterium]|nr:hypothetical protein [Myxococcales bacterium]